MTGAPSVGIDVGGTNVRVAVVDREGEILADEHGATPKSFDDLVTLIVELGRKGVKSLEDLADLAAGELAELVPGAGLTEDAAGAIIMDARVRLGWIEPPAPDDEPGGDEADPETEQH